MLYIYIVHHLKAVRCINISTKASVIALLRRAHMPFVGFVPYSLYLIPCVGFVHMYVPMYRYMFSEVPLLRKEQLVNESERTMY